MTDVTITFRQHPYNKMQVRVSWNNQIHCIYYCSLPSHRVHWPPSPSLHWLAFTSSTAGNHPHFNAARHAMSRPNEGRLFSKITKERWNVPPTYPGQSFSRHGLDVALPSIKRQIFLSCRVASWGIPFKRWASLTAHNIRNIASLRSKLCLLYECAAISQFG